MKLDRKPISSQPFITIVRLGNLQHTGSVATEGGGDRDRQNVTVTSAPQEGVMIYDFIMEKSLEHF